MRVEGSIKERRGFERGVVSVSDRTQLLYADFRHVGKDLVTMPLYGTKNDLRISGPACASRKLHGKAEMMHVGFGAECG